MGVSELRRLRQLEDENRRLKHLVADLTLDKKMLQDVLLKKSEARTNAIPSGLPEERYGISQRYSCRLLGLHRSTCRYVPHPRDDRALLMIINNYSEVVLKSLGKNDPLYEDVEEIRTAGNRAASLTRQLLAFSRKQILTPNFLERNGIVSNLDKLLRRLIGEDIERKRTC